jgi:hypothetical protein
MLDGWLPVVCSLLGFKDSRGAEVFYRKGAAAQRTAQNFFGTCRRATLCGADIFLVSRQWCSFRGYNFDSCQNPPSISLRYFAPLRLCGKKLRGLCSLSTHPLPKHHFEERSYLQALLTPGNILSDVLAHFRFISYF